ncbi:hypothetical protein QO226_20930 [Vibrio vulnificus]|uniref:hypothetical protein n=1 Tax=Vibrio vulnificus TaxID=672 RepID=UPI0002E178E5|nr:hypothetical protein [Vibrio vulnificus]MDK2702390.1 hypothetical protein [Vibrio vulnificus]
MVGFRGSVTHTLMRRYALNNLESNLGMFSKIYKNYQMISPLPVFWWLAVGLIAQKIYPLTKLNSDNVSVTTLQFGLVLAFILTMLAMFLSFLWEDKSNDSKFLNFIYSSSRQFADLAMGVAGFSSAYFLLDSVYWLPAVLIISSLVLSTCLNHIYLVVFNKSDVGTYGWISSVDKSKGKVCNPVIVKVFAGLLALGAMTTIIFFVLGWLKA